jgi:tocopherol cyclase
VPYVTRRVWEPALYQGGGVTRRYFEGWYFKHVDAGRTRALAVIPGVSYSEDGGSRHAFVQVVPSHGETHYFAYPAESFTWDRRDFEVRIGDNVFSREGITLALEDGESSVSGELRFGPWRAWPVKALSPGIMGWYRFVPGMETYHGVLSMDHSVTGRVVLDGEQWGFDGGRGYVEKDWGRSFPSSWVWAQSNTFGRDGISVTLSVARVPWMGSAFVGSIAGLLLDGDLHRFATYTGAKPTCLETGTNEARIALADSREELEVHLHGHRELILKSPVLGAMEGRDAESLGGTVDVTLRSLRGGRAGVVFRGTGAQAGIEVMNAREELGRQPCDRDVAGA